MIRRTCGYHQAAGIARLGALWTAKVGHRGTYRVPRSVHGALLESFGTRSRSWVWLPRRLTRCDTTRIGLRSNKVPVVEPGCPVSSL